MTVRVAALLSACLLAVSTVSFAQGTTRFDCSQAQDPKACEERRAKLTEARDKAARACEGRQGSERRECMRREMCAQAKDPRACEERAARAKAAVQKARQACEGRQGQERRDCVRQELNRK